MSGGCRLCGPVGSPCSFPACQFTDKCPKTVYEGEIELNTSPPGKALRYNEGKAPLSHTLDYPRAMKQLALVAEYGAGKYNRGNFQQGQKASVTINSMFRHLTSWWCGEDEDPESGCHHLAHFLWNAVVLVEDMMADREGDDDRTFNECDTPRTEDIK